MRITTIGRCFTRCNPPFWSPNGAHSTVPSPSLPPAGPGFHRRSGRLFCANPFGPADYDCRTDISTRVKFAGASRPTCADGGATELAHKGTGPSARESAERPRDVVFIQPVRRPTLGLCRVDPMG